MCIKTKFGVASGPRDFIVLSWPRPAPEVDGPPYSFEGVGDGASLDLRTRLSGLQAAPSLTPRAPFELLTYRKLARRRFYASLAILKTSLDPIRLGL